MKLSRLLTIGFVVISAAAVLGALVVRVHPMQTGPLGPYAGAAAIILASLATFSALQNALGKGRAAIASGCLIAFAAASELCGILTGFPFGEYRYTGLWWPSINLVSGQSYPLFVPLAWYVFVVACYSVSSARFKGLAVVAISGLVAAVVDIGMEPVMTGPVGFWTWKSGLGLYGAPLENFAGWFVTGAAAALILFGFRADRLSREPLPRFLLLSVLGLTVAIGVIYAKWEALIGLPILGLLLLTNRERPAVLPREAN